MVKRGETVCSCSHRRRCLIRSRRSPWPSCSNRSLQNPKLKAIQHFSFADCSSILCYLWEVHCIFIVDYIWAPDTPPVVGTCQFWTLIRGQHPMFFEHWKTLTVQTTGSQMGLLNAPGMCPPRCSRSKGHFCTSNCVSILLSPSLEILNAKIPTHLSQESPTRCMY